MTRTQALREAGYCIADSLKDIMDADALLREVDTALGVIEGNDAWHEIRNAIFTAEDAAKHARKLITATT